MTDTGTEEDYSVSDSMLTTTDNPFDPFDQFDEWFAFDLAKGYNTCGYIARVVVTSPSLPQPDQELAIDQAIDEIVRENVLGIYKKVVRGSVE